MVAEKASEVWSWLREKILPAALLAIAAVGIGMYTELRVISVQMNAFTLAQQDHESRLRAIEQREIERRNP